MDDLNKIISISEEREIDKTIDRVVKVVSLAEFVLNLLARLRMEPMTDAEVPPGPSVSKTPRKAKPTSRKGATVVKG
jgi:hypothetical protein